MEKRRKFQNVTMFRDRHGVIRWRYRKGGVTVALGADFGSETFIARYNAAVRGLLPAPRQAAGGVLSGSPTGSLSSVIDGWYKSSGFVRLGPTTQYVYKNIAENLRKLHGEKTVQNLQRRHIKDIMAKKAEAPSGANNDLRVLRMLLDYAIDMELITQNPARTVKKFQVSAAGYHAWTEQEIQQFYDTHPPGSVAHTCMTLMLCTGAARSDVVTLGPHSIQGDRLLYQRKKMQTRNGVLVSIPIHRVLAECLARLPDRATFLETAEGKPRTPNGLGSSMRAWCNTAGLPQCSSHGLRKACARRLIEAGATPHEMMAVTGHKTLAEAQRYADTFDRAVAADRAMQKQGG